MGSAFGKDVRAPERREAVFDVSSEVLASALVLPPGTRIRGVSLDVRDGSVRICVEHADLKPVPDGNPAPFLYPRITQHAVWVSKFDSWGQ